MASPFTIELAGHTEPGPSDERLLAEIASDVDRNVSGPATGIELPRLAGAPLERWISPGPVRAGEHKGIVYRENVDLLFGVYRSDAQADMEAAAHAAYRRILGFLAARDEQQIMRVWNYFPDIHGPVQGGNRYQAFCLGRQRALQESGATDPKKLPAATVIGSRGKSFLVYFLASAVAGLQIENPRQLSAFHYPQEHGPVSPAFSRATLGVWGGVSHLLISGTASIVGHRSQHPGDIARQLDETLENVQALLGHAHRLAVQAPHEITQAVYLKVYLKQAEHLAAAQAQLRERVPQAVPVIWLQGDICRPELLVEIEAVCRAG